MHPFVDVGPERFGSLLEGRTSRNAYLMAKWYGGDGDICDTEARPGVVSYYMEHYVYIEANPVKHIFAVVRWMKPHENSSLPSHLSAWSKSQYERPGPATYLPVQRILHKCVLIPHNEGQEPCFIVSPLYRKYTE